MPHEPPAAAPGHRAPSTRALSDEAWSRSRAWFRGVHAEGVTEYANLSRQPDALAQGGWWAVVAEFEGDVHAWRFADVERSARVVRDAGPWHGPVAQEWTSSMDRTAYTAAVAAVRAAIRDGEVYQANICRILTARLPGRPDPAPLAVRLARGNPAPYAALIDVPEVPGTPGCWVVSASPELSIEVADGTIASGPIKGTAARESELLEKDRTENVMITDLVRNDLQRVCRPGTVTVTDLLRAEHHPGLVHLVSRVRGNLHIDPARDRTQWQAILAATHPPGSVSGAPKSSALRLIDQLESAPRGPYCGQIGWIDADRGTARLAVGIRTFWWSDGTLAFGTGAGITWGSDPAGEWSETELKAARLLGLASR
ncbi:chorismate-binding protein [Ruania halotolerans]|uniref:chorismate-binding protein n=1 Tax=Ruania halotolerans TaxID=2897773 RepID=UPI001E348827|nr:chorismate-binding protein [Ruania halotolerans]UFU04778.1 chorismate-binding protein [Ruania halotolerans]